MTAVPTTLRLRRESTLRSRAARGDATAFAAVYERHHQALYRYCRSILRHEEDAQDALQSTMTRAFAALQDEQRDFELRPWLFRIAHNEAISILRKRRSTTELDDIPVLADLEDRVSEREELRLLTLDLADLPDRQRAALVLRELNGLSHAEIAVVLETSAANVKQTIYEARSALFSAREGREMPCDDVRRMLSDGDGRVLRGRGVRAHLRSCAGCRRFHADIDQRSKHLAMLAPPLPTAGAAALLAQIVGGGGAAKLLACVAIAGGGATVAAVEFYKPPPRAAAEAPPAKRERPVAVTPTPPPAVTPASTATPGPVLASTKIEPAKGKQHKPKPQRKAAKRRTKQPLVTTPQSDRRNTPGAAVPDTRGKPEKQAKADRKVPPGQANKEEKPAKDAKPERAKKDQQSAPGAAPGQAKKGEKTVQAKPESRGRAKQDEGKQERAAGRYKPEKQASATPTAVPQPTSTPEPTPPAPDRKDRGRGRDKDASDDDG